MFNFRNKNLILSIVLGSSILAFTNGDQNLIRSVSRRHLSKASSKATKSPKATKRPEVKRATQACTDNPDFRVNKKVKKSCDWISATSVRMENNCVKPKVLENCPVACGKCPRKGPNDEPTMDEGSTGSAGANKNSKSSKKSKCSLVPFDLPNTTKLGAEVYKFEPRKNSKSSSKAQKIADNGIEPDSINKYAWSSALDDEEDLYIGTFNINFNIAGVPSFENNLGRYGAEEILKLWSGSPLTYSEGGAIYKRKNDGKFKRVLKAGHDHVGFRKGINYDGDMYFGSANGKTGAKIFTNKDSGDNFKVLDDESYLDPTDSSIRAMCTSSHSNRLFMGTENLDGMCGPSILAYDGTKGIYERERWSKWDRCTDINMGYGGSDLNSVRSTDGKVMRDDWYDQVPTLGFAVAECTELEKGKMLFGTWNGNGYKLVVYDEKLDIFSELATPPLIGHDTNGVMELRVFNGHLYVGLLSYRDGFALIRTSIDDTIWNNWVGWEEITLNGFAEEQVDKLGFRKAINPYPWSSTVADGVYYIGTFAGLTNEGADMFSEDANPVDIIDGRAQLWSSANGLDWTLEEHNGFDQEFTYGFRTMQATSDGSLYIGTASNLFLPDLTRAPYTDFLPDLTGDGNEDICLIVDEIESAFFTFS